MIWIFVAFYVWIKSFQRTLTYIILTWEIFCLDFVRKSVLILITNYKISFIKSGCIVNVFQILSLSGVFNRIGPMNFSCIFNDCMSIGIAIFALAQCLNGQSKIYRKQNVSSCPTNIRILYFFCSFSVIHLDMCYVLCPFAHSTHQYASADELYNF